MKAEIIGVGTELLMGQISNTDAQFLSRQLSELGIDVFYHHVVGDNMKRLGELLLKVLQRSDIVITTGGLGPTLDDLTKDAVAAALGLDMVKDQASEYKLNSYFESIHRDITINNFRQAYFPEGSKILPNSRGTAPGCLIEKDGKTIIILPGPPRELDEMFLSEVKPYLMEKSGFIIKSNLIKVFGVGESELESRLMGAIESQTNPTLATYASAGQVALRVTAKANTAAEAKELLEPVVAKIKEEIGDSIYSIDGESMPEVVIKLLAQAKKKVAFAESCTGGMLSSMIVDVPGSSAVLEMSAVTYSNDSKMRILGVSEATLNTYGAVSEETVKEMARGALSVSGADIAVSISGIAGPDGGTDLKPVGLIYVCLSDGKEDFVRQLYFARERNYNRTYASLHALDMIRRYLTECL